MNAKLKHPRVVRWAHWFNFPLLFLMIWSGLLIYWANDIYRIGIGDFTLVSFFPTEFYEFLKLRGRLAEGMAWHFFLQWFFVLNGVIYVVYTMVSGEWRMLLPTRKSFAEAWQVFLYDVRIRKTPVALEGKFNGAQQIIYTSIIVCGALSALTGYAMYKPVQLSWLTALFGGYEWARFIHFWLTMGYVLFFVVHVIQVARAGWNNFRAMVTGYEVEK